jgi:hypothetical protein
MSKIKAVVDYLNLLFNTATPQNLKEILIIKISISLINNSVEMINFNYQF